MYTGIVQEQLAVKSVDKKDGLTSFSIGFPEYLLQGLETGASVSVNGVCFTVTSINSDEISFDAVRETLELSNIKYLEAGTMVNIERSAKQGAEVGGHVLSGHVVGTARVQSVELSENNCRMTFRDRKSVCRERV